MNNELLNVYKNDTKFVIYTLFTMVILHCISVDVIHISDSEQLLLLHNTGKMLKA